MNIFGRTFRLSKKKQSDRSIYDSTKNEIIEVFEEEATCNIISFFKFMQKILKMKELSIDIWSKQPNKYHIYGKDGISKLLTIIYILEELERYHIIILYKNNSVIKNTSTNIFSFFRNLTDNAVYAKDSYESAILPQEISLYFIEYAYANIWISPKFEWYKKHEFISEELYEAKQQVKYAKVASIFAGISTIIALISLCITLIPTSNLGVVFIIFFKLLRDL